MDVEFGNGKNMLYRYLTPKNLKTKAGFDHPDPMLEELTYGEGYAFSNMIRRNVTSGSHIFFHTTIGGQRYITAHYLVSKVMEGFDARQDKNIRVNFKNPHIHPESYPEWWSGSDDDPDYDHENEKEDDSDDIMIFGETEKSIGKLVNPLPFDRDLAERLEFEGKRIEFDITNKRGRMMRDSERITSCTRTPRYITTKDVKLLYNEIASINQEEVEEMKPEVELINTENLILETPYSEKDIEELLFRFPEILEKGLKVLSRQESLPTGRVDLLLKDNRGEIILLEIKEGFPRDSVITQVLSYKNDVEKKYPGKKVKCAILCQDCSKRVQNAAKNGRINIYTYGTFFKINKKI